MIYRDSSSANDDNNNDDDSDYCYENDDDDSGGYHIWQRTRNKNDKMTFLKRTFKISKFKVNINNLTVSKVRQYCAQKKFSFTLAENKT